VIAAIDGGILKEVSIGCAVKQVTCSICGEPYGSCDHRKGREYNGEICYAALSEACDAYEFSFVAVPAQPMAGVVKGAQTPHPSAAPTPSPQGEGLGKGAPEEVPARAAGSLSPYGDGAQVDEAPAKAASGKMSIEAVDRAKARLQLEKIRFGGI